MAQDRAIVTMADHYEVVHDLSIDSIFNDLERSFFSFMKLQVTCLRPINLYSILGLLVKNCTLHVLFIELP